MKFMLRKIAAAFCLTMAMIATAEAQNSFAYQAVIRTAKGELVSNQKVGMKFSLIHDGEVVYSETHTPETNQYGNVQVEVGKGQNATGDFAKVPWNTMQVMMKIEADPNGGTNYIDLGTIQLQPAPYAMYAPMAGEVRTIQAGDPKSDSNALFEVKDKDGNVVFAVYPDGVRVFVNDEDTTGKAMPTGFAVSGRKAAKEGDDANIFAVNAAGTQVFVNDEDTAGGKAMPTGFAVSGRKAAKDGSDLFTVGSTGTQVYIDPDSYRDATKAISTGFAVSGRKAAKGENDKYLEINADGTRVYVDDADSDKPIQTGFAVSGRKAAKGEEKILEINAEGTKIYVGEDGKAVSTGFAVSGRKAAKGKEIKLFEVNSFGTQIYIDAQKDKAMSTGFAVSGRKAAKDGNRDKYMVIDADGTVIYVDYEEAKAMQTGFAVSGRKASKDGEQNTILKVNNTDGTRIYIDDVDGKAMQTGFAVSGRKASKDGEPNLMSVVNGQAAIASKSLSMQDKETDKNLMEITPEVTAFSTPEFSVTDHNDSTLLSADTAGVGVHTELVVTGDVAQVEEFEELEEILPISLLVQKIDTIKIADSVPALYNANGYELLKMYGNGLFAPNQAVDVEGNNVLMFNAKGNLTKTQQDAAAAVLMIAPSTPNARLIIWPLKQANNLKISFGLMSAGDTTNRYVNVDAYINVAAAVECQVAVKSEVDTLGTVQFSGPKVYGAKLDLIPTPIEGYHFTKWSDGRVSNPRTVLILHDTAYSSANFEINTYNILATGEHGTVTVDGNQNADSTYNHGTRLTLKTHADAHYHFLKWTDGDRSTPRQLIIKRDTAFNAVFAIDSFPVTADAKNGKVTGTGIYPYNSEIELTAVADSFYHFLNWSDGSTDNPLKLTVDDEINMTAYFEIDSYTLTVNNPDEGEIEVKGSRNADWTYDHGTEIELTATAVEPHYHFDHWFDGSRNNPHKVTVKDNMTVTAVFMLDSCTVSTTASEGGTAVGGGTVEYGTVIELCAYPDTAAGYHFTNWSDGDNTNPRQLKVKKDAQLVANFSLNTYTVAYIIDGDVYGEAEEVAYGTPLTLRAAPVKEGYTFGGWSNAPATMPMHNVTITGTMPANKHTIKYKVDGADYQTVSNVEFGTRPRLAAAPEKDGYTFSGWQNVPATMPDEDITIEGTFAINRYTIAFNTNSGSAVDTIKADYGAAITAPAAPTREGYTFDGWDKALPETMPAQNLTLRAKWIINKYTITFDTDGGTAMAAMSVNYSKPVSEPAEPRKKGYTFVGWDSEIPAKMPAENLTIKALWKANQYTISFDANGGSSVASITADYGTAITKPAEPTRLGYHFDGWDEELPATIPAENLTLKAQWTQLRYTVGVETANGTISGIGEYTYGQKVTLTAKPDAHYHFVNWGGGQTSETVSFTVEKDTLLTANFAIDEFEIAFVSEGKTLQSGKLAFDAMPKFTAETPTKAATAQYSYTFKEWSPAIEEVSQPTTYTAVFDSTLNQYTITYVVDGEVSGQVETYNYGEVITIRTVPNKEGYGFSGWDKTLPATMPDENITVSGTFSPNSHTITYKVDGEVSGDVETYNYGAAITLRTVPNKEGYGFSGWDKTLPATMPDNDIIVSGTFTAVPYDISYILDGGNFEGDYPTEYNVETETFTLEIPKRWGYQFAGWIESGQQTASINVTIEKGSMGLRSFLATWNPIDYSIHYETNGGTLSDGCVQSYTVRNPVGLPTSDKITRPGYNFVGWYTNSDYSGNAVVATSTEIIDGQTFYAKWQIITLYYNFYELVDGRGYLIHSQYDELNMDEQFTVEDNITLPTISKAGYHFDGWQDDNWDLITGWNAGEKTANVTLFAKWTPYTVTFDPNGGEFSDNTTENKVFTYSGSNISILSVSRFGYDFAGWYTNSSFEGEPYTETTILPDDFVTFYAKWTPKKYTLTFMDGETQIQTGQVAYGTQITAPTPTKAGYTFLGWAETPDATTAGTVAETMPASALTYYAVWQRLTSLHVKAGAVAPYIGTTENPFATIADAVGVINGSTTDYTIIVDGKITGNQTLGTSLNGKAQSITLCGDDNTTDILDGGNSGTVLTVETSVPVVISNLKITNGNTTSNGGGINIGTNSNVTLGSGAKVSGNRATAKTAKGGGIYTAGILIIDGGVVGDETATNNATYTAYSNYANGGGGIYFDNTGKVTIKEGSVVAYNFGYQGGGIATANNSYCENAVLTIEGGEIRYNGCDPQPQKSGQYYGWNSYGGGLFLDGCKFVLAGGSIHHNFGCDGGGGLFLQLTTNATMSGGSIHNNTWHESGFKEGADVLLFEDCKLSMTSGSVYSDNLVDNGVKLRTSTTSLEMSGSATISQNTPVYLTDGTYITITGELSTNNTVAVVNRDTYSTGTSVLQLAEGVTNSIILTDASDKFLLSSGEFIGPKGKIVQTVQINSAEQLQSFINELEENDNSENYRVCINNDLTIDNYKPFGCKTGAEKIFKGVFDGNGHILKINSFAESVGIYSTVCYKNEGIIKNLKAQYNGELQLTGSDNYSVAGICFNNESSGIIRNCWNDISYEANFYMTVGGVCSTNNGLIENSLNTGNLRLTFSKQGWDGIYGIAGGICGDCNGIIKNCVNYGTITLKTRYKVTTVCLNGAPGAICGRLTSGAVIYNSYWCENCVNTNESEGNITLQNGDLFSGLSPANIMIYSSTVTRKGTSEGCGYFSTNGALTAGTTATCGQNQTLGHGTNLLDALNDYVNAQGDGTVLKGWKVVDGNAAVLNFSTSVSANYTNLSTDNIASFSPQKDEKYIFVLDNTVTNEDLKAFSSIFNSGNMPAASTLDMSGATSITKIGVTGTNDYYQLPECMTIVNLPPNVELIEYLTFNKIARKGEATEVTIADGNANYKTIDGVLFENYKYDSSEDYINLLFYPPAKEGSTYTIPSFVTRIEDWGFQYNRNLETINGLNQIVFVQSDGFRDCQKLKTANLPNVTGMGNMAFANCPLLESVTIGTLSSDSRTLDHDCFVNCHSLKEIHFLSSEPIHLEAAWSIESFSWDEESWPGYTEGSESTTDCPQFFGCNKALKFYVPSGSKAAYLNDTSDHSQFCKGFNSVNNACVDGNGFGFEGSLESRIIEE